MKFSEHSILQHACINYEVCTTKTCCGTAVVEFDLVNTLPDIMYNKQYRLGEQLQRNVQKLRISENAIKIKMKFPYVMGTSLTMMRCFSTNSPL